MALRLFAGAPGFLCKETFFEDDLGLLEEEAIFFEEGVAFLGESGRCQRCLKERTCPLHQRLIGLESLSAGRREAPKKMAKALEKLMAKDGDKAFAALLAYYASQQ